MFLQVNYNYPVRNKLDLWVNICYCSIHQLCRICILNLDFSHFLKLGKIYF